MRAWLRVAADLGVVEVRLKGEAARAYFRDRYPAFDILRHRGERVEAYVVDEHGRYIKVWSEKEELR